MTLFELNALPSEVMTPEPVGNMSTTDAPSFDRPPIPEKTTRRSRAAPPGCRRNSVPDRQLCLEFQPPSYSLADVAKAVRSSSFSQTQRRDALSAIDAAMAVATQHGRFVGISWTGADAAGGIGDQWFALSMRTRVIYAANDLDFFSFTCEQLADPEWKGRVCIRSGQHPYNTALFSALVSHQDAAATEGWLTGLKFNVARKTGGGDRDGAKDILGGICDIAVASSYVG